MNAPTKTDDPFAFLMTRRIEAITLKIPVRDADGNTTKREIECEIRDVPLGDFMPLRNRVKNGEIDNEEFGYRMLGMALYCQGQPLTYERVKQMTPSMLSAFLPALPIIQRVYGIGTDDDDAKEGEDEAANGAPKKKD